MKLKDVEIQVQVEGSSLEEYDVRCDESGNGVSCYVTSEAGKRFSLRTCNSLKDTAFVASLYIDGVSSGHYITRSKSKRKLVGLPVDQGTLRPFMFSRLKLTDNDSAVTMPIGGWSLGDLGTLRFDLFRVTVLEVSDRPQHYTIPAVVDDNVVLHEKTKKAGTHRVQLGEKIFIKDPPPKHVKYIDSTTNAPYMSFTFRYRPQEMLQAQGIIPVEKLQPSNANGKRPGPHNAGPSKRTRMNDDHPTASGPSAKLENENGGLKALLAQRAVLNARIREERIREVEDRRIKRELSPIVLDATNSEVIDLTLD